MSLDFGKSPLDAPASHSSHHGIVHNLLEDAITTARGIPFGIVQTVKHPVGSVKAIGQSYADLYGHGWGHFWNEFKAHPLQPLLDAISVPLVLAGGAGFAIKGASIASELGHAVDTAGVVAKASELAQAGKFVEADAAIAESYRLPGLKSAAQHFEKGTSHTTKMYDTGAGFSLPKAYSSNVFRRFMTQGTDAVLEGLVGKRVGFYSEAGKGKRLLAADTSRREAAAAGRAQGQAAFLRKTAKIEGDPRRAGVLLQQNFTRVALTTGHKVAEQDAVKLGHNTGYAYVAEDPMKHPSVTEHTGYQGEPDWHRAERMAGDRTFEGYTGTFNPRVDEGLTSESQGSQRAGSAQEGRHFVASPGHEARPATRSNVLKGHTKEQQKEFVQTLGGHFKYTSDPAKAWKDEHGNLTIMRGGTVGAMRKEVDGAMELADKIYRFPLKVWKAVILGDSPRYLVNNVVGNGLMYAFSTNPVEATQGMLAGVRAVHGIHAAARMEKQMTGTLEGLMAKHLPEEFVHEEFGFMQHGALSLGATFDRTRSPWSRGAALKTPFYKPTEMIAYRGPQRASLMGAMTTMPQFRKLVRAFRKQGLSGHEAFQKASHQLLKDPRVRAAVEKRAADWAGQYYHLNSLERGITALVPFYTWTRHALRFGKEQALSRPVASSVLARLGALGDKEAEKELGHLPDFMKGAIPVSGHAGGILGYLLGQRIEGRKNVIMTSGLNPLAAGAEDAAAIGALFGQHDAREAIGGQLNPVISGFLAGVTGEKLFSGAKNTAGGGPIGSALSESFVELPHVKLVRALIGGSPSTKTKQGGETLYTKSVSQQISSLLGVNARSFSPATAEKLYREEKGIKKGRRHKRKKASSMASALKSNLKSQL